MTYRAQIFEDTLKGIIKIADDYEKQRRVDRLTDDALSPQQEVDALRMLLKEIKTRATTAIKRD